MTPKLEVGAELRSGSRERRGVAEMPDQFVTLGRGMVVKGDLSADHDLVIDGQIEGSISMPDHNVEIGPHAKVRAHVIAKTITVVGSTSGTLMAGRIDIRNTARVEGHVASPRLTLAEGAHFTGTIDTVRPAPRAAAPRPAQKPVAAEPERVKAAPLPAKGP